MPRVVKPEPEPVAKPKRVRKPKPLPVLHETREGWLRAAIEPLSARLHDANGTVVPSVRVSVGFPYRGHGTAIGQCWAGSTVTDNQPAVFISPVLDDAVRVLDVLMHELVHAAYPGAGHSGPFSKTCRAAGLVGPWTATTASDALRADLAKLATELGQYPHARIHTGGIVTIPVPRAPGEPEPAPEPKGRVIGKQTTRMLKVACSTCGYTVRTTRKWLDVGLPSCPDGDIMEEEEER